MASEIVKALLARTHPLITEFYIHPVKCNWFFRGGTPEWIAYHLLTICYRFIGCYPFNSPLRNFVHAHTYTLLKYIYIYTILMHVYKSAIFSSIKHSINCNILIAFSPLTITISFTDT